MVEAIALYLKYIFFNDESSWDPCNLQFSGVVFGRHIILITHGWWLESDQQCNFLQVYALCNCHYEEAIFVYLWSPMLPFNANLLDSSEYKTLQNRNL